MRRVRSSSTRRGFTLIEAMVALALSALILMTARSVIEQMDVSARGIAERTTAVSEHANVEMLLRDVIGRAEVRGDGLHLFTGGQRGLQFRSWCESPHEWLDPCEVALEFTATGATATLAIHMNPGGTVSIGRMARDSRFRYLRTVESGGQWDTSWTVGVVPPLAVGIINGRDTSIVRIGVRG
jgi:prepilin-type N-terminal cleavage/methylation domain-containing protein